MVIEWREVALAKDVTNCASGACAVLSLDVTNQFEGIGTLSVTVLDASPWDSVNPENDCNGDGDYGDAGDDQDCDDDGTLDVTVRAFSDAEIAGEIVALNRVTVGGSQWRGEVSFSSAINMPGVLYIVRSGAANPTVNVRYLDRDDGTGNVCANDADPTRRGTIDTITSVFVDGARIIVKGTRIDNTVGTATATASRTPTRPSACS